MSRLPDIDIDNDMTYPLVFALAVVVMLCLIALAVYGIVSEKVSKCAGNPISITHNTDGSTTCIYQPGNKYYEICKQNLLP